MSRYVNFNESLMLHPIKKLSDADEENIVSKQVEFNYESLKKAYKITLDQIVCEEVTFDQPIEEEQKVVDEQEDIPLQNYNLARGKEKR